MPNWSKESCTLLSNPRRIEVTVIATVTPITTPSTVRKERTLCVRIVSSAIFTSSDNNVVWGALMLQISGLQWDQVLTLCEPDKRRIKVLPEWKLRARCQPTETVPQPARESPALPAA